MRGSGPDWTTAEESAARRYLAAGRLERAATRAADKLATGKTLSAGEQALLDKFPKPLGPNAKRTLAKLQRRLERERQLRATTNWAEIDRQLREDGRAGRSGMAEPTARPGGAGPAAPSRAATAGTGTGSPAAGGALALGTRTTSVDSRRLSDEDYVRLLQAHGFDAAFYESRNSPPPPLPSAAVGLAQQALQRRAAKAQQERAAQIEAGQIDARAEKDPAVVQARLQQLGLLSASAPASSDIINSIRPPPEPLKPPEPPPKSKAQREAEKARRAAERRDEAILADAAKKRAVDARKLSGPEAFRKLLEVRGYWPGDL